MKFSLRDINRGISIKSPEYASGQVIADFRCALSSHLLTEHFELFSPSDLRWILIAIMHFIQSRLLSFVCDSLSITSNENTFTRVSIHSIVLGESRLERKFNLQRWRDSLESSSVRDKSAFAISPVIFLSWWRVSLSIDQDASEIRSRQNAYAASFLSLSLSFNCMDVQWLECIHNYRQSHLDCQWRQE